MIKNRWLIVSAAVLFLGEIGLQMSGVQSVYLSIGAWVLMLLILGWAVFPAVKGIWGELGSWTEPQKTLATLAVCVLLTVFVSMLLASRKILLWNPDEFSQGDSNFQNADPKVVETTIREWLDAFNFGVRKIETRPNSYFNLITVTPKSNKSIQIRQPKKIGRYLVLEADLLISKAQQEAMTKLPLNEQTKLIRQLRIEINRLGVGQVGISLPLKAVSFEKQVPIDRSLTQHRFIENMLEVEGAMGTAVEVISLYLDKS